ncbi:MAG: hypothetical protein F6K42_10705 [Leptolyngbya sp. SIO1D8]|nr:hypothetical protein [Leptolyngbya sp. SIO1D8]
MNNGRSLRVALLANAMFSSMSAGLMVFAPELIGTLLGIQASLILQIIGLGLGLFAVDLYLQAMRPRLATWRALYASAGDFLWVVATVLLRVCFPDVLSDSGNALVIFVAGAVLAFGVWQLWAVGHLYTLPTQDGYRLCLTVQTNAPASAMWRVISHLEAIQTYAPSLKQSLLLDGKTPGVGAVRMCENHAGKRWFEECIKFQPDRSLVLRFVTEAPDFPFPVHKMNGGWEILPYESGSQIRVWWELMPKPQSLTTILLPLLALQVERDLPKIIQAMAAEALGQPSTVTSPTATQAIARLLPTFC